MQDAWRSTLLEKKLGEHLIGALYAKVSYISGILHRLCYVNHCESISPVFKDTCNSL